MPETQDRALFCHTALLAQGWTRDVRLVLRDQRISAVVAGAVRAAADTAVAIAIPGLANLHSHAFQRALAGLAERSGQVPDSFWTWREAMYRFLDRMDPDDVEAIAALAYAEMLEAGFTRVGEFHYLHHDPRGAPYADIAEMARRIAAAAAQTGIALTLLPSFYAHGGFGVPPTHGQRRFISTLDGFARLLEQSRTAIAGLPGAVLGVAPHSLRAAEPDEIAAVVALLPGGPVHIHAAEQTAEVEACLQATGRRPVELLLERLAVSASWCLIHATHMTGAETEALAQTGAVAGLCPLTEASLGDGIPPAVAFRNGGGRIGIGTDSNIQIDAAAELRQLEYGQRLRHRARNLLAAQPGASTGRSLFAAALTGGAQALGQKVAGLAEGGPADIVVLDPDHPSLVARADDDLLDGLIFAAARSPISAVWCGGRQVVRDGRHIARAAIAARYRARLTRLLA